MPVVERIGVTQIRDIVVVFRDLLRSHQATINRLNVYPVPDGDTGTNMARTLDAVVAELDTAGDDMGSLAKAISHGSLMGARGNSGVILSQMLRGLAGELASADEVSVEALAKGLRAAATGAYQAVLRPVEGTILTVAREVAEAAEAAAQRGDDVVGLLRAVRQAGEAAVARTPDLLPVLRDAGVVDAGARGFVLLIDAALHVVAGDALPEVAEGDDAVAVATLVATGDGSVSDLRYEVMFFLDLVDERINGFKDAWGKVGDAIVVVGGDGLWNCHVHTDDVGAAIEAALDVGGRPRQIRVTDLTEEAAAEHAIREAALAQRLGADETSRDTAAPARHPVVTAVVAVAVGDGIAALFASLGVRQVVTGGQTMNPSTAELLAAVEMAGADEVVILPNNRNIIPVAEQVDALTNKAVRVVPTRSMPEALAALVVYDPEGTVDANTREMVAAVGHVRTGEVTQAVRDATIDGVSVREGDWLGLADGKVAVSSLFLADAATTLLAALLDGSSEIVTILTGQGSSEEATAAITGWLADVHPGVEVELHQGGQPLYPYLFGVE